MKWYEDQGYIEDPFSTKKGAFIEQSVNLKGPADELAYNIEAGNMVLVDGPKGTGKTLLLFSAIEKFEGERKVIYFDCSKDDVDIKKLMQNKYGIIGKILNLTPKGMVLMLDNFKALSKKDLERVKYYFDNNYLRSIVFAGNGAELPENIRDRIGNRVIRLKVLAAKDAVELVRNRLGSLDFLPEVMIKKIYAKSKKNAVVFLEKCGKVCQAAAAAGAEVVGDENLKAIGGGKSG